MEHRLLPYKSSQISYYSFGSGPKAVLCFHGYGEEATAYSFLSEYLDNQYSLYAIDLPFHGKTRWNEGLIFGVNDLHQIVSEILQQGNYRPQTAKPEVTLIGFSLGGRILLQLYQAMPEKIEKIILMAPDGLKVNRWYWFATQTWMGSRVFKFTMRHPRWLFGLLKLLNGLKLVNTSIFKFVNSYIGEEQVRTELYERWVALRKIKPDIKKIKHSIASYRTPTKLLYGEYDKIILPARGEKFRKGIEAYCDLTIIPSGHQLLHEKHAAEIVKSVTA